MGATKTSSAHISGRVERDGPKQPYRGFVTADGFGPDAIGHDHDTDCWLWQGAMRAGVPVAHFQGRVVSVRRLAYERVFGPVQPKWKVRRQCHQSPCINPAHARAVPSSSAKLTPEEIRAIKAAHGTEWPEDTAKRFSVSSSTISRIQAGQARRSQRTPLRTALQGKLPPMKPTHLSDREWIIVTSVVAGHTLAEIGTHVGLTRERVRQIAAEAARRLLEGENSQDPPRSRSVRCVRYKRCSRPVVAPTPPVGGAPPRSRW